MNNLKKYRLKCHFTQSELAKKVGVISRYIAFIEAGERIPSLMVALRLAATLGVSVEDIFLTQNCTIRTNQKEKGNEIKKNENC